MDNRRSVKSLRYDMECAPWSVAEVFEDIDDVAWAWKTLYKDILSNHLSERKVKIRSDTLPWMNAHIRKNMNKGYKLLKQAKETGSNVLWSAYKKLRETKLLDC